MPFNIVIGRNEADKKKFGDKGTILIARSYVKMGQTTTLSNYVYMDVIRSHVVFVVGKRGCLTGETPIFTDKGFKPIKEFNENKDKVYSYNLEGTWEWENAKLLKYPIESEDLFRIETEDGQYLDVTKEHPLLIAENEKLIWKKAHKIKETDHLINATSIPEVKKWKQKLKNTNLIKKGKHFSNNLYLSPIKKISKISGVKKVYDLRVPKNHSFIANGVISHNSGKSYSAGVIAEGMIALPDEVSKNLAIIMLDTMGIYWSMKYPNEKDADLLEMWELEPKGLDKIQIFTPEGVFQKTKDRGIPTDHPFSIKASELSGEDWRLAFEMGGSHPVSVLIEKTLGDFAEKNQIDYTLDDMMEAIKNDETFENTVKNEAINRLKTAKGWGLFSDKGTNINVLIKGGSVSVLDVSAYAMIKGGGWGIKSLVIGLIANRIFIERMISRQVEEVEAIKVGYSYFKIEKETKSEEKKPLVWFFIDEAHEMLPFKGKTAATDALVTILREGRQPGLSLLLITQQPGKIHTDVLTQSDIVLAHRLTARRDVDALNAMMQSYLGDTLTGYINMLPAEKGAAIILDDNSERLIPVRMRPKFSWHGGEAPSALEYKRSLNLGL